MFDKKLAKKRPRGDPGRAQQTELKLTADRRAGSAYGYSRARLIAIVLVMAGNSSCAVIMVAHHHYPLGIAPILFLIPGLLREMDLRQGQPPRRIGIFEWSCFLAGILFLAVLPIVLT
jgi:hypothetical protein